MYNPHTERALLKDLRSGIPEAVTIWYKRYEKLLTSFVAQKVENKKDVEEIVRDTFINCLRHLPLFQGKCSLKTWMFQIASHEIADYYRKRYAKKFIKSLPLSQFLLVESPKNLQETASSVNEALTHLREDYRELLQLKYIDQLSVEQIAEIVNKSIKSVESDLFRARKEFRSVYAVLNSTE